MKKTKIVSTLGPASSDVETITKLIESGANVVRFNFSHGDHEEHLGRMNAVREAEKISGKTVGFLLDTKGAEIRTTVQEPGKIEFNIGDVVRISMDASLEGTKEKVAVTYPGLFDDVKVGGHVLFDDGKIDMLITERTKLTANWLLKFKTTVCWDHVRVLTHLVFQSTCQVSLKRMPMTSASVWNKVSNTSPLHSYVSLQTLKTSVLCW